MKLIAILFFFAISHQAIACPLPFELQGESYCAQFNWTQGEKKVKGQFQTVDTLSPHLIASGESPLKWIYSSGEVKIWMKSDPTESPLEIPSWRVFPYMTMADGHHHPASYQSMYDTASQRYRLNRVAFHQMSGCWELRWTTAPTDTIDTSDQLSSLTVFANLNEGQNKELSQNCGNPPPQSSHGGHHH